MTMELTFENVSDAEEDKEVTKVKGSMTNREKFWKRQLATKSTKVEDCRADFGECFRCGGG